MKERKSQQKEIKEHLLRGKKISQKKALVYYDITRLTSVIHELKKQGWDIKTEYRANERGGRYAVYYMEPEYISDYIKANTIFGERETIAEIAEFFESKNQY